MIDLWTGSVLLYPASCNTQKKEKVYQAPPDLGWAFSLGYLTPTMAKKKNPFDEPAGPSLGFFAQCLQGRTLNFRFIVHKFQGALRCLVSIFFFFHNRWFYLQPQNDLTPLPRF